MQSVLITAVLLGVVVACWHNKSKYPIPGNPFPDRPRQHNRRVLEQPTRPETRSNNNRNDPLDKFNQMSALVHKLVVLILEQEASKADGVCKLVVNVNKQLVCSIGRC